MRRATAVTDDTKPTDSHGHSAVYVLARREYNEQVGSIVSQRDNWRLATLGALATAFVAVGGAVWDHTKNHPVPYVVRVDRLGDALAVSRADVALPLDPRIIRAQLARWVTDLRTVLVDVAGQRTLVTELYAMLDKHGSATPALNDWYSANSPFLRAADETVGVQVLSVLPKSATTWQVQWREDHRNRDGTRRLSQDWEALITFSVNPANDDASILLNPTGLFVEAITWQKI